MFSNILENIVLEYFGKIPVYQVIIFWTALPYLILSHPTWFSLTLSWVKEEKVITNLHPLKLPA